MKMFCDNQDVISIAKNSVHRDQAKPVETDRHFIKKKIQKIISLVYTPTTLQTTNILAKTFSRTDFEDLRSKLRIINFVTQLVGECGNPDEIQNVQLCAQLCYKYSCVIVVSQLCHSYDTIIFELTQLYFLFGFYFLIL